MGVASEAALTFASEAVLGSASEAVLGSASEAVLGSASEVVLRFVSEAVLGSASEVALAQDSEQERMRPPPTHSKRLNHCSLLSGCAHHDSERKLFLSRHLAPKSTQNAGRMVAIAPLENSPRPKFAPRSRGQSFLHRRHLEPHFHCSA